jgi:hypothetical protein
MAEKITKSSIAGICEKYGFVWDAKKSEVTIAEQVYPVIFQENGSLPRGRSPWKIAAKSNPQFAADYATKRSSGENKTVPMSDRPTLGVRLFSKYTLKELETGAEALELVRAKLAKLEENREAIAALEDSIAKIEELNERLAGFEMELPEDLAARLDMERLKLDELTK